MNNNFIWTDMYGFYIYPLGFCFRIHIWKELGIHFDCTNRIFISCWWFGISIENRRIRNFLKKLIANKLYYTTNKF